MWVREQRDGVTVTIRLTPRADRDALGGLVAAGTDGEALQARVRAAPSDGEANGALIRLIAGALNLPKSVVEIEGGHTQRVKRVRIRGDAPALKARLKEIADRKGRA